MRSQRLSLLLWAAGGAATWLLFAIVYADASKLGHERRPQAVARSGIIHEAVQADMPAEVVPKILGDKEALKKVPKSDALRVCIMTADFWGLKSAGGTATAYHLLAAVLAKEKNLHVTFLQVTRRLRVCQEAVALNTQAGLDFQCLSGRQFDPEVAEASPYEAISHAALKWLQDDNNQCDVVHAHEWGGVFADVVTANYFRQLTSGLRIAIEPHGGHVWSQLGEMNRPMDVGALRIDNMERLTNQLNDIEISPTNYMLSFLKQRGWTLPNSTIVIPNVVPDAERHEASKPAEKKVWRIAFFSRLEERKGIKLFVEALQTLQETSKVVDMPKFEVYIVGPEAVIDMVPSRKWLTQQTAEWTRFKTHLKINIKREEALNIISMEGILLVLCSYIDNMPYVVAEAAVKEIPFLTFDAGGVLELFDHDEFDSVVVKHPTSDALAEKLDEVLTAGKVSTVRLTKDITSGQRRWVQWHTDFANQVAFNKKEDEAMLATVRKRVQPLKIVPVARDQSALDLWEPICLKGNSTSKQGLLLLPDEYEIVENAKSSQTTTEKIAELLEIAAVRGGKIGGLTFGIELPINKVAYPMAPTWIAYAADHQRCLDTIPVAITTEVFCNAFLGQARVFRNFNAWVLAMLLEHTDRMMHVYPEVFFKASEFNSAGSANCASDKIPKKRRHDYAIAANRLFRDADEMMRSMVLSQTQKPLVSLLEDITPAQRHKGWEFGYLNGFANTTRKMNHLVWEGNVGAETRENKWGCGKLPDTSFIDYPHFNQQLLHPCHHLGGKCCNGTKHAPFMLRLTSFFHADQAALVLAYDAYPVCGDGFDFMVTHYPADLNQKPEIIVNAGYDVVSKTSRPQRQKLEVPVDIRPGDQIDFVVDPRNNHDCDGLYIVEAKIWPPSEGAQQSKKKTRMLN